MVEQSPTNPNSVAKRHGRVELVPHQSRTKCKNYRRSYGDWSAIILVLEE